MVSADPCFILFGAFLILMLPLPWVLAAFFAALIHELCHLFAVYIFGGSLQQIRIGAGGAQMDVSLTGGRAELLSVLAGPAGSFLLICLYRMLPRVAFCGCIQGLYNLLPVWPLDGGRILACLLDWICPDRAHTIMNTVEILTGLLLMLVSLYFCLIFSLGYWPLIIVMMILLGMLRRKIPCKRRQIGVQ